MFLASTEKSMRASADDKEQMCRSYRPFRVAVDVSISLASSLFLDNDHAIAFSQHHLIAVKQVAKLEPTWHCDNPGRNAKRGFFLEKE